MNGYFYVYRFLHTKYLKMPTSRNAFWEEKACGRLNKKPENFCYSFAEALTGVMSAAGVWHNLISVILTFTYYVSCYRSTCFNLDQFGAGKNTGRRPQVTDHCLPVCTESILNIHLS